MTPTWDDTIREYFIELGWLPEAERAGITAGWNAQMTKLTGWASGGSTCAP